MILASAYQLEKSFATRLLFRGLTFAIESGDRIGLIGPNGAGKSTMLRILAGQTKPDKGDLSMPKGLQVGFLEQTPEFAPGLTVFEAIHGATADPDDPRSYQVVAELISKLELGGPVVAEDSLIDSLSGGWRKRVALARELAREPLLLLLDEPTNHLDLESILWLEEFLAEAKFATMTVTHDRLFLQRVANRIFDLDPRNPNGLLTVAGDYTQYLEAKELLMHAQERREVVLKNTLRRETEWLRRGAKARQTKQQARIQRAGDLKDETQEVAARNVSRVAQIDFQSAGRNPQKLIEAIEISKSYGDRLLFENLTYTVSPKTRLGLLGKNGIGKSTLIRVLLGQEPSDTGSVKLAENLEVAYFEQNRQTLKPELTVIRNVCPEGDYVNFQGQFVFARSYLDRFLFRSEQMDMPVAKLSGGEQARLRIAQLMLQKANVLVLDEPTNDLDLATLNVLEDVLKEFKGAVILVTHDRYFLDQVVNDILAFPLQPGDSAELERFASYEQWENWAIHRKSLPPSANPGAGAGGKSGKATQAEAAPVKKRKLSFKEKFELEHMEENIHKAEARLGELQAESAKPEIATQGTKLTEIFAEIAALQSTIEKLYARWAELE
jgi:ATP-binding cassette subfamily F protein uup